MCCLPHPLHPRLYVRFLLPLFSRSTHPFPSHTMATGKPAVKFGFLTGSDSSALSKSPILFASWLSVATNLLHFHHLQATSFWETFHQQMCKSISSLLLVRQELKRIDHVVAHPLRRGMRPESFCPSTIRNGLNNQDHVRVAPSALCIINCIVSRGVPTKPTKSDLLIGKR